ncbi:MAG: hypothetical protein WAS26_08815, partial [Paracoccaceae bacterium]
TGYLRKRLPQELIVLQGGAGAMALATGSDPVTTLNMLVPETRAMGLASGFSDGASAFAMGAATSEARTKAKMQGFTGDPCGECGNYTLVRNGTCLKCNTCGGTTGCS